MIHVIPYDDLIEHTSDCECCVPFLDPDRFWIHHAKDKREQFERNGDIRKPWQVCYEDEITGALIPLEDHD